MNILSRYICWRRLKALCRKETFQILRDPSTHLIAFALPLVLLFIFSYGIDLDAKHIRIGLLLEDTSPEAREFADSLFGSPYLEVHTATSRQELTEALTEGRSAGRTVAYSPDPYAYSPRCLSDHRKFDYRRELVSA